MYQTIMEVTSEGPRRMLGSASVVRVDGRLSVWRAKQNAKVWAKGLTEFRHIKSYVVVLFSSVNLAGHWEYRAHVEVTGTATIPAIRAELN
jgi:hypothetical protein